MIFQTQINIPVSTISFGYDHKIMALGSCFAENIGLKMQEIYFETEINPFGVLYNPISINNSIDLLIKKKEFTIDNLFKYKGLWQCFSHSSLFSDVNQEKCLQNINDRLKYASNFLAEADILIITFGTAWIFEESKSGRVVSNCHKLPSSHFNRRRLTVDEIVSNYSELILKINNQFPKLKLIFSVSPIRHWKDGAHENNLSKSTLLLSIDELQKRFINIEYFPAYEIMMDELRDYRFYASDMLHPSEVAIDYIWQKFESTFFNSTTKSIKKELEMLRCDLSHRPIHPNSAEHNLFKMNTLKKINNIQLEFPNIASRIK